MEKADSLQETYAGRIVLPRKVFVIDRMYTVMSTASMKEEQTINRLLVDIVKNGAKSGIHLILSCRDISHSWSDQLVNGFMYRFILKSRLAISKRFLDSEDAMQLSPGEVLVNDAELEINEKYKTPFIDIGYTKNIKKAIDIFPKAFECFRMVGDMEELPEEKNFESLINEIDTNDLPMVKLERLHLSFEEIDELVSFVEKKNNTLDFDDFQDGFIRVLEQDKREKLGRFKKETHDAFYGGKMVVCPEPFSFLRIYDERVNAYEDADGLETQDLYWKIFEEDLRNEEGHFQRLDLTKAPDHHMWYNSTDRGINLRPGLLNNNRNNPFAVTMGNEFVHGLVVGRTGAGKSVFLNNLIFNLLYEYAPWELDLFLVDFKKVELSRYMSKGVTPHVNACAATSEVRYVVSMIEYLVNCMNARQNFFSRLGLKDIASFRREVKKRFGVEIALPRVLLLVDEFQQMFLEATNSESDKISNMLTAITKLGRATGYHLLFASQEMSATLSGNVFANFKIRFALLCEQDISANILGNSAAAHIRIGEVLLNTESGAEEDNRLYKVPFINDKNEDFFYNYLSEMREKCEQYGYKKNWKFYEEDRKEKIDVLSKLNVAIYKIKKQKLQESGGRFFDIITLGSPVVYNNKNKDWETFFIERGSNKNIMVASPNVDDLVYIQKLLAVNFSKISSPNKYQHVYCSLNPIIRNKYKIETEIDKITMMYTSVEQLEGINASYYFKASILKIIKNAGTNDAEFLKQIREIPNVTISDETFQKYFSDDFTYELIPSIIKSMPRELDQLKNILKSYENYRKNDNDINAVFAPTIIWISGCDDIKDIIRDDVLKNATSVNMLFIFFATAIADMDFDVMLSNDYIFIGGNEERFYDKFDLPYTKKDADSIVIDFKIKSLNTCRSFKKFSASFADSVAPSIDFDSLNLGD